MSSQIRLNLDTEADEIVCALRDATKARSKAEVIRNALAVFNNLHHIVVKEGRQLGVLDRESGTYQNLTIPSLEISPSTEAPS